MLFIHNTADKNAILIEEAKITWVGPESDHPSLPDSVTRFDAKGKIILPGFIDCHTHLVFAGSRSNEFAMRSRGMTYREIMKAGGGILNTVNAVRLATKDELVALAIPRLARMLHNGVTTIEAKSGYGLNLRDELKILEVLDTLRNLQPVDIECTFLGAHAIPPEYQGKQKEYVEFIVAEMLPAVAQQGIATACDVFVEDGAFSVAHAQRIFEAAKELGLKCRVHAEQLSHQGGAHLACEIGALSASHLEHITSVDIATLAKSKIVAEILPIAQEYLCLTPAPARALIDAGVAVAIATDFNPGSAMCSDLLLAARLAITSCGLTCEEALDGITKNAAKALGRANIGIISAGARADLCVLNTNNLFDLFADWSTNPIQAVFKHGELVLSV